MAQRPGIMIYFDLLPVLEQMPFADQGQLVSAMLHYGRDGALPDLPTHLQLVWPLIQFKMDLDSERYTQTVNRRKYAAYTRWSKDKGLTPDSFTQWLLRNGHLEPDPEDTGL